MTGIATRFLQMAGTLWLMSFAVFCLIGLMPGDPIDLMIAGNPHMTPDDAARLRALHGLDKPLLERYGHWLAAALGGDFGYSRLYGLPVLDVIFPRLGNTLVLLGAALGLTVIAAVPVGVYAARMKGTRRDALINFIALAGMSVPPFWTGIMLVYIFSAQLGVLPASATMDNALSLFLPVVTLALSAFAVYVRHMRSAMADTLKAEHVKTARAKGCGEARIVWHHAFRNALPPVVTIFMLDLGALAGGTVTIETVFAFPGMGKLMFDAVMGNDYNLALVGFLILTALVLSANFVADALYGFIDPRVRARGSR